MLIYRDVRSPRPPAFRVPDWLVGCSNLNRQTVNGQDWFWVGDAAVRPDVPDRAWHPVPGEFEVASVGPLDPSSLLRHRPELVVTSDAIEDGMGRAWRGLVVYDADLRCQLTLRWGRKAGEQVLSRIPEPWQEPLLQGALAARAEIEADRLSEVPPAAAMSWVIPLMCELYHLHPEVIVSEQLVDDRSAVGFIRVAAGYAP